MAEIRAILNLEDAETLLGQKTLERLQTVQKSAARLFSKG